MATSKKEKLKETVKTRLPLIPADLPAEAMQPDTNPSAARFPVVGIGASAGGLAAFEAFFSGIPAGTKSGAAFVLVQHLAPDHKSILAELIRRYTSMQVFEVEDGMVVKPDCAYIIPPNHDLAFLDGVLHLFEPAAPRGQRLPVDFFFRSLAQDQHERAICVVLSGTGSDGTMGIRAIKGEGGMVIAQDPETTEHDGMPRSAITTGLVDFVLPPAEMHAQIIKYTSRAFGAKNRLGTTPKTGSTLKKISIVLHAQTGHDFSQYKETTVVRRVERRMALQQIEQMDTYLLYLQKKPDEVEALFRDLLIGVTSFFRDPEAFAALQRLVIPRLFAGKPPGSAVRVWVCGCSTGEEAYSIAMLIQEHLDWMKQNFKVQIFATDIDKYAIDQARMGTYPASISLDISPERLGRFFSLEAGGGSYRIQKSVRDLLIFSEQDVVKAPPFSRLDLVSCRNLLIYMNADLQKKLLPIFHYALKPGGSLFLGTSETVGDFLHLFTALERKWKIYARQETASGAIYASFGNSPRPEPGAAPHSQRTEMVDQNRAFLRSLADQTLLDQFAQTGVLVNEHGEIFYIYGHTGDYLELAPGEAAGINILAMARQGLKRDLTNALHKAAAGKIPVSCPGLKITSNGADLIVNLVVRPAQADPNNVRLADLYMVILNTVPAGELTQIDPQTVTSNLLVDQRIAALEEELKGKEEYLQTTFEEMETANEELKSTNEELQSVNEELQSTNEELETSKEELQSVNEELTTVNTELQTRVAELSRSNNDMNNLLAGTGVGMIFVDMQMRITRFTPAATQVINLINADIGRPVGHIVSNLLGYDNLIGDLEKVLDNLIPFEAEVLTKAGNWLLMRIRPYRTLENVIEGAVITFVDITERNRLAAILDEAQKRLLDTFIMAVQEPVLALDANLNLLAANPAFCSAFALKSEQIQGRLYALNNHAWDSPDLRQLLEETLPQKKTVDEFELDIHSASGGTRRLKINARQVSTLPNQPILILLAFKEEIDASQSRPSRT